MSQVLLKILILSGMKEVVAVTTATPLDLKSKVISVTCCHIYSNHVSCSQIICLELTRAGQLFHKHQWRYQEWYHHLGLCCCLEIFQSIEVEYLIWNLGFSVKIRHILNTETIQPIRRT